MTETEEQDIASSQSNVNLNYHPLSTPDHLITAPGYHDRQTNRPTDGPDIITNNYKYQ